MRQSKNTARVTTIEYALIAGLIAVVIITAVTASDKKHSDTQPATQQTQSGH